MGGENSITYAVPITQKPEGETAIYRSPYTKDKLYGSPTPELTTIKAIIINSSKQYPNNPALGTSPLTQAR